MRPNKLATRKLAELRPKSSCSSWWTGAGRLQSANLDCLGQRSCRQLSSVSWWWAVSGRWTILARVRVFKTAQAPSILWLLCRCFWISSPLLSFSRVRSLFIPVSVTLGCTTSGSTRRRSWSPKYRLRWLSRWSSCSSHTSQWACKTRQASFSCFTLFSSWWYRRLRPWATRFHQHSTMKLLP